MRKIKVKQQEKLSIKLTHQIKHGESRRIDLYISLPKEMGINKSTLSETEYFNAGIKGRRAYFTEGLHLPLLHTRFANRMKRSPEEYKSNLNLFAYQYIVALDTDTDETLSIDDSEGLRDFYHQAIDVTEQCLAILKKHRLHTPSDPKLLSIFENVDNYLSWYTEQSILHMLAKKPRHSEFSETRLALLAICDEENIYRKKKAYNTAATLSDPNRISNKMRLLRRLIEYGVIFKSETHELGKIIRKVVTGVATALIMSVVLVLIIKTQGAFSTLSALMIFILAVIYGIREVFKDDFKNMLWRWIRRGKPKWARTLKDSTSKNEIATQRVWLDYINAKKLPTQTVDLLARRHSQNKQSAEYLHYRVETKVSKDGFQAGYNSLEETILFSLRPFARYLERGTGKVYEQNAPDANKEKIQSTSIERRYQINIVVALDQGLYTEEFERYKITLNRSGIIDIVKSGEASKKDKSKYGRYTKLKALLNFKKPRFKSRREKKKTNDK
ncbi:hypothetical protein GCM10007916_35210 [Psychromonas marina]|uniref:Uncharacterized protein n=1 Tax=Psychromonas marina TaxID=88364 RepID=A0ABQ6E4V5_9GAMM|nr:hypothetical protein [Psychromonas marina]GLS92449.1 hypothetical protein GCM10007916_35210 [Psychromonas marina]